MNTFFKWIKGVQSSSTSTMKTHTTSLLSSYKCIPCSLSFSNNGYKSYVQHLHSVGRVVTFDWAKLAPANAVNICMRSVAWFEENQMHSLVLYLIIVLYRRYVKYNKFKSNTQRRMTFCIHNGNMTRLSQWRTWCVE